MNAKEKAAAKKAAAEAEAKRLADEAKETPAVAVAETEPEAEAPVVETPPAAAGLFIPDAVKEVLAKPKVHIDKTKEALRVRTPFVPVDHEDFARCLAEGRPFTGLALWESVYVQPLTDGSMLVNIGTSLQYLGTLEQVAAETNEGMAIRGGQGGGVNAPAMQLVFGNPEALRILQEAGVPLEGDTGLFAQFKNTSQVQALRSEHRNWRSALAEQARAQRGGGRPGYVRPVTPPSGVVQAAPPAGEGPADFKFE